MAKSPAEVQRELIADLSRFGADLESARTELTYERGRRDKLLDDLTAVRRELADARAEGQDRKRGVAELQRRADAADTRVWGLVTVRVGALLALAAGLIVALARK